MTEVYIEDTNKGIKSAVNQIFSRIQKSGQSILKSSKEVYIKVNGIHFQKHTYTSPEVLEAVILYLKEIGADVYVMENCTQANFTRIVFAITGSGRVIPKYWQKFLQLALDAGVDRIVVYVGNGCALPIAFKDVVMFTKNIVKDIPVEVHAHQDLGLAVANTLSGVEGGAEIVDVVFNGLGDRAGNAATEEVIMALEILYGINLGLKLDKIMEISQLIEKYSRTPLQAHKAIVGKNCFVHESDLHVEQILRGNWVTWELFQPHIVGQT